MRRALGALTAGVLVALWAGSLAAWPELPARLPQHFDAGGEVTRWAVTSLGSWLLLPAIATALVLLATLGGGLLERFPRSINIPDREAFLALPPARRRAVIERVRELLLAVALESALVMSVVQWTIWRRAHGGDATQGLMITLGLAILSTPLLLAVFLPRIQGEVDRQRRMGDAPAR